MVEVIKKYPDGIDFLELKNDKLTVVVTNYGCTIQKILAKDKNGELTDIVLGYDELKDYQEKDAWLGAFVGRYANRIKGAKFCLNGETIELPANEGKNQLHGGAKGFSHQVFDYTYSNEEIIFTRTSPDGEEGFPGTLKLQVHYILKEDALVLRYEAKSDKDTIINLTNHSYFNLAGHPCSVGNQVVSVQADRYCPVDGEGLPCSEESVEGTPYDLREKRVIQDLLDADHPEIKRINGIDNPFLFAKDAAKDQVHLYNPDNGLNLKISTNAPGCQVYIACALTERIGKGGQTMGPHNAICFEPQFKPNDINTEEHPGSILRAGDTYVSETSYRVYAE